MDASIRDNAFFAGFAAALMLLFGWGFPLSGLTDSALYNRSVDAFTWTLRLGGIGLLTAALLCFLNLRIGLLIDALVSALSGALMLACSLTWLTWELAHGAPLSLNGILFIIFGGLFLRSAVSNGKSWRALGGADRRPVRSSEPPDDAPPHPASIRPRVLAGDVPPPEGYLAALAREDDDPLPQERKRD